MKRLILIIAIPFVSLNFAWAQEVKTEQPKQYQPSVLIELFSSEGCSSCPFADEFLKEVIHISDSSKSPVYVIDFHVDIWNRSGWVDPFSDSTYTMRQQVYAYKKKLNAVYTPMVFVNGGDKEFAGADKRGIGIAIQNTLKNPSGHYLRTGVTGVENEDSVMIGYQIWGDIDSCDLRVAFVQREINNLVKGGENIGQILHHHNVVKALYTKKLDSKEGLFKIPLNHELVLDNFRLLVFVQHRGSWKVFAVDQLTFKP